ncbi:DUF885 domain-containing protein [Terricaulis silvestris]|uniref:DUF885 domain-containing protein n=1 Tax=Terricaulis silvestris TaxID=2686094 RepID=A0A6I6MY16_9CAUL|nr:DUF885 family protein [Terricaulis silvestris]QGZ96063.1 hypothetical protein DSM104635_02919 [Terricaulis silvestris]
MHMTRRALMGATAAGIAITAAGCGQTGGNASARFTALLDQLCIDILKESPESSTSLGVSEEQAGGRFIDKLDESSREAFIRQRGIAERAITALQGIDRAQLTGQEPVTYDVALTSMQNQVAAQQFEFGGGAQSPYVVTQLGGAYTEIPDFLDSRHPVTTRDETEAYLSRLSAYARKLDQESAVIAADAGAGMIPPDFCIDGAVNQLRGFAGTAPAQTVLVTSLVRRLPEVSEIPEADRAGFLTRAETIVRDEVLPAYQRQIEALTAIRARAVHDAGISGRPRGAEMYEVALQNYTTTNMTADEIHNMGVELVTSINAEMDTILRANGLTSGTVAARMTALGARRDQVYPNTDAGRTQLLADLNAQVAAMTARMPEVCGVLATQPLRIERVPEYIQAGAPGGYYQPASLDGTRPGTYYINLRDTAEWPKFSLPALSNHEGVPGHHWQIAIQQEAEGLPFFRTALSFFGAFIEGWGLYSEMLADEMGMFADNPLNKLGYLQSAAFRSSRLVVDTGIHSKGWTREQAIDSMMQATGQDRTSTTTEIERYCVIPGQACSYMVGRQAILRMRDSARTTLGAAFDLKGFHDTLLTNGSTPLTVTEQLVNQWVASVQAPA